MILEKGNVGLASILAMLVEELLGSGLEHGGCLHLSGYQPVWRLYKDGTRTSLTTRSCVLITLPSSRVCSVKSMAGVGSLTWIFSIARSRCVAMTSRNLSDIGGLQAGQGQSEQRLRDEKRRSECWQNGRGVTTEGQLIGDSARLTLVLCAQTLSKYHLGNRTEID